MHVQFDLRDTNNIKMTVLKINKGILCKNKDVAKQDMDI